jgi:hypothetical protein
MMYKRKYVPVGADGTRIDSWMPLRERLELATYEEIRTNPNALYVDHALYLLIRKFCELGFRLDTRG